jgi:hypothetical protein
LVVREPHGGHLEGLLGEPENITQVEATRCSRIGISGQPSVATTSTLYSGRNLELLCSNLAEIQEISLELSK